MLLMHFPQKIQETRDMERFLLTIQLEETRCPTLILIRQGHHRFTLARLCEFPQAVA